MTRRSRPSTNSGRAEALEARKIWILKRDRAVEPFDRGKIRVCLLRGLTERPHTGYRGTVKTEEHGVFSPSCGIRPSGPSGLTVSGHYDLAEAIAAGIEAFLYGGGHRCASSAAVFEMTLSALRAMGLCHAAEALERQHTRRAGLRACLAVGSGSASIAWSKHWLVQQARARRAVSRPTARILAGIIEQDLTARTACFIDRLELLAMLDELVESYGLAPTPVPNDKLKI